MANIPSSDIQARKGHIFPDMERTHFSKKETYEYAIQIAKALYGQYSNNLGDIPYQGLNDHIDSLRLIARGRQSPQQYKDYFTGAELPSLSVLNDLDTTLTSNAEASRKGWFTGFWDVVSVIPNMKTKVKGDFLTQDSDIKTFSVDSDASSRELLRMNTEWAKHKTKKVTNFLRASAGMPPRDDSMTDSYEALMDIKNEGGFKDRYAIAIEQAIQHTEDVSNWKLSLKEKLFDDIFDIGVAFAINDYDTTLCKATWNYVDVKDFGCQFSFEKDYRDCQAIYWFEYPTLNKIREMQDKVTNGKGYGLSNEDIEKIANNYKNYEENINSTWWNEKTDWTDNSIDLRVCVMHVRIIDVEKTSEFEYENNGKKTRLPYKDSYKKNKKYKEITNRVLKRYDVSWIVGTDFIYDFGWAKNQMYIGNKPCLGFAGFKLMEKSYIERLVPIAHAFAIEWIKFINSMAKSQSDFLAVNRLKIAQFSDGDKKYDPLLAIKMLREELVYFYDGDETTGGDSVPIKKIDGTAFDDMMKHMSVMEGLLRQAEFLTGLSPVSYGATPDNKTPVRTSLASINSSNTALNYLMNAAMVIKTRLAEQTIPMICNLINADEKAYEDYAAVIGEDDVKAIQENEEGLSRLGLKLYPRPTNEMKELLSRKIEIALQQGLIDVSDSLRIEYQLYHGSNFMETVHKLDYKIRQEKARQTQEKQALIDRQTEGNKQAAQIQAQSEQAIQQNKMASEQAKELAKGQVQMQVDDNELLNDIKKEIVLKMQERGEDPTRVLTDLDIAIANRRQQLMNSAQPQAV